jgi:high-affinity iron transporter
MVRGLVCIVAIALAAVAVADTPHAPPLSPAVLSAGRSLYEGSAGGCFACHGVTGEGNGPVGFALKPPPRNFTRDPFKGGDSIEQVYTTITNGLPNTAMVPFTKLTDYERWALAYYVLTFRPKK